MHGYSHDAGQGLIVFDFRAHGKSRVSGVAIRPGVTRMLPVHPWLPTDLVPPRITVESATQLHH